MRSHEHTALATGALRGPDIGDVCMRRVRPPSFVVHEGVRLMLGSASDIVFRSLSQADLARLLAEART